MKRIFVTGISTGVGKTIASAILTEALGADYWKPIQVGDLDNSDAHKVSRLLSNKTTFMHPSTHEFNKDLSPYAAAELDGVHIEVHKISEPETENHLIIEGAGGLLVPINESDTILDIIQPNYKVVVVSRHYPGSINHTLLTVNWLQLKGYDVSIIFSGDEHPTKENIILKKTGVGYLGRINEENSFNKENIKAYAKTFLPKLQLL